MANPKMLYVSEQTPHGPHTLDIYSRLLDDQIILLTGEINEDTAESIIAQLLYLEAWRRTGTGIGYRYSGKRNSQGQKTSQRNPGSSHRAAHGGH